MLWVVLDTFELDGTLQGSIKGPETGVEELLTDFKSETFDSRDGATAERRRWVRGSEELLHGANVRVLKKTW